MQAHIARNKELAELHSHAFTIEKPHCDIQTVIVKLGEFKRTVVYFRNQSRIDWKILETDNNYSSKRKAIEYAKKSLIAEAVI